MSRYQVGQKVIVGFHEVGGQRAQAFVGNFYKPWEDKLVFLHLVELTCIEHHAVASVHDPEGEKKYDGYVFQDKNGHRWYNQYPHASYSQLGTDADAYFSLNTRDGYRGRTDSLHAFEDITETINRLNRGVYEFEKFRQKEPNVRMDHLGHRSWAEMKAMLDNHLTYVIKKIEKTFECAVDVQPYFAEYKDGTREQVRGHFKTKLIYPKAVAVAA